MSLNDLILDGPRIRDVFAWILGELLDERRESHDIEWCRRVLLAIGGYHIKDQDNLDLQQYVAKYAAKEGLNGETEQSLSDKLMKGLYDGLKNRKITIKFKAGDADCVKIPYSALDSSLIFREYLALATQSDLYPICTGLYGFEKKTFVTVMTALHYGYLSDDQ